MSKQPTGEELIEIALEWMRMQQRVRWNIGDVYKPELVKGSGKEKKD